jgi:four helix bundle protein
MYHSIKDLVVYQKALEISDLGWEIYIQIPRKFYQLSGQFITAVDSIGANIAEGYGRGSYKDRKNFLLISRGSLYESAFWLERLTSRLLIAQQDAEELKKLLTKESILIMGYIKYLKSKMP